MPRAVAPTRTEGVGTVATDRPRPVVGATYGLAAVTRAWGDLETRTSVGKRLLAP